VNVVGGGILKVAKLTPLGIDFHVWEFAFASTITPVRADQVASGRVIRGEVGISGRER
jgi:hypothetical protein